MLSRTVNNFGAGSASRRPQFDDRPGFFHLGRFVNSFTIDMFCNFNMARSACFTHVPVSSTVFKCYAFYTDFDFICVSIILYLEVALYILFTD